MAASKPLRFAASGVPIGEGHHRCRHSDLEVRTVLRLREERHWGARRIAKAMGVSLAWADAVLRGVYRSTAVAQTRDLVTLSRLAATGAPATEIARTTGYPVRWVQRTVRRMRLQLSRGPSDEQQG